MNLVLQLSYGKWEDASDVAEVALAYIKKTCEACKGLPVECKDTWKVVRTPS